MSIVVLALMKDAHEARGLVRALDDAGFSGVDIDPATCIVGARADDEGEATEAAQVMSAHGALGVSTGTRRS